MITDVFLNQVRVNVCEYSVKMAPHESFLKVPPGGLRDRKSGGAGGKIKWKLSEVDTWAISRGQNELIGKFKMATGNVICIGGRLWGTFQQKLKESW